MNVLGLDTSSRGWAAVSEYRHWTFVSDEANPDWRRAEICRAFRPVLEACAGGHVFCEEPLALQNGKTTRLLGLAAGALWAQALEADVTWHWVDVASWKASIVGRGNADKAEIRTFCRAMWRNADWADYEAVRDLYDARCLRAYGLRALAKEGIPLFGQAEAAASLEDAKATRGTGS